MSDIFTIAMDMIKCYHKCRHWLTPQSCILYLFKYFDYQCKWEACSRSGCIGIFVFKYKFFSLNSINNNILAPAAITDKKMTENGLFNFTIS